MMEFKVGDLISYDWDAHNNVLKMGAEEEGVELALVLGYVEGLEVIKVWVQQ